MASRRQPGKRVFLVQDYAGGMRIRYAGRDRAEPRKRIDQSAAAGWPRWGFVVVLARTQEEAFEKAEPRLLAAKARHGR